MKSISHSNKEPEESLYIRNFFESLKVKLFQTDFVQFFSVLFLITIGIIFIYSAGQHIGGNMSEAWKKQIVWAGLGFIFWLVLSFSNYRIFGLISPLFYIISIILLILVYFVGVELYGARRWLDLGVVTIQPSEFTKIATLLFIARIASLRNFDINNFLHFGTLAIVTFLPFVLILRQPDLGSSFVFLIIFGAIVFAAKLSWKRIILIIISGLLIIPCSYPFLKDYQKERILVFLNPDRSPLNQGWTGQQAILAVGSGGFSGKGFLQGTQNTLGFLPDSVANSDLIFSVIAEESGFIGCSILIILYAILLFSILRTAYISNDKFGSLISVGIAGIFFSHSFVNLAMNIRLMPITGLPLPLVSYGGSFMLTSMICLGLLQSVYRHSKDES